MSSQPASLWDIAVNQRRTLVESIEKGSLDASNMATESHLLVCGSENCGKSSLILRFLEREEATKPTVALDFCYGKRSKPNSVTTLKDVVHIWELGGGSAMGNLIDTVITSDNIRKTSIVLMLDLSQPNQIWDVQDILLKRIRQQIDKVIKETSNTDKTLAEDLKRASWERIGTDHVDKNMITPILVPLFVIGSKFDVYQDLSGEKKQMIAKTVRFLAHTHGAMLQFYTNKAEGLAGRAKQTLNHLAFRTPLSKTVSLDGNKPIISPFGCDSLELIGAPSVSSDILSRSRDSAPTDIWRGAFLSLFPVQREEKEKKNPAIVEEFADSAIDNVRKVKDQEVEDYRRVSERKANEALINAEAGKKVRKTKVR